MKSILFDSLFSVDYFIFSAAKQSFYFLLSFSSLIASVVIRSLVQINADGKFAVDPSYHIFYNF
jgi:hypothetical protein